VIDLGTLPGGSESEARSVNAAGDAVGWSVGPSGSRAVAWRDGQVVDLAPSATTAQANGINKFGDIVGYRTSAPAAPTRPFLWRNGTLTDLGSLGGSGGNALAINDRGQIVGYSQLPSQGSSAFLWEDGVMTDLGRPFGFFASAEAINRRGDVVGIVQGNEGVAHLWRDGQAIELEDLGGVGSIAFSINSAGQAVGYAVAPSGENRALLWVDGGKTDLGTLAGMNSAWARGINSRGDVVGHAFHTSNFQLQRPVLWTDGTIIDLGTLGGASGSAIAINDHGVIVGYSLTAAGKQHATMWIVGPKGP
jgi:probable HAF family extracellular repeat protein